MLHKKSSKTPICEYDTVIQCYQTIRSKLRRQIQQLYQNGRSLLINGSQLSNLRLVDDAIVIAENLQELELSLNNEQANEHE